MKSPELLPAAPVKPGLRALTAPFQAPQPAQSVAQIATSFGGFLIVCAAMYFTVAPSIWLTLGLSVLAAGFLVRIFIIQHDCGHGAFFRSRTANQVLGFICGLLTLTPYHSWKRQHAGHHGIWNNLDRRQSGVDIYSSCMTVAEYRALSRGRQFLYRIVRHPLVSNIVLPPVVFLFLYRFPFDTPKARRRERQSVYLTNVLIAAGVVGLGFLLGFDRVALVHVPIIVAASIIGVWLFSVQHRFERSAWRRQPVWTHEDASMEGSSHLDLPPVLRWFTGNIGFHHIHHLNPKVPNYRLQDCHQSDPDLQTAPRIGLWSALGQWRYALWDEVKGRMVDYREAAATAAEPADWLANEVQDQAEQIVPRQPVTSPPAP
ncbi:MAG: fatty acid desaturase [Alphaproteobacteria bacterium]